MAIPIHMNGLMGNFPIGVDLQQKRSSLPKNYSEVKNFLQAKQNENLQIPSKRAFSQAQPITIGYKHFITESFFVLLPTLDHQFSSSGNC